MKINSIWIAGIALILTIIVLSSFGIQAAPFIIEFLTFAIPLVLIGAVVIYVLILATRYVDAKVIESKTSIDFYTKIALHTESLDRIEKKLDKIESLLENSPRGNGK